MPNHWGRGAQHDEHRFSGDAGEPDRGWVRGRRPGTGIGHRRGRRRRRPDGADPHSAGDREQARPGGRRDGNRQDQDAAADRRTAQRRGCTGADGRREGRPVRAVETRGGQRQDGRTRQGHRRQLDRDGIPGGIPLAGCRRARCAGSRHRRQFRSGPAIKGVGAQCYSRVDAGPDLPLGQGKELPAGHPGKPACCHHPPDQRRGQGRPEIPWRSVVHNGGRHPARAGEPGGRGRRHVLR